MSIFGYFLQPQSLYLILTATKLPITINSCPKSGQTSQFLRLHSTFVSLFALIKFCTTNQHFIYFCKGNKNKTLPSCGFGSQACNTSSPFVGSSPPSGFSPPSGSFSPSGSFPPSGYFPASGSFPSSGFCSLPGSSPLSVSSPLSGFFPPWKFCSLGDVCRMQNRKLHTLSSFTYSLPFQYWP